MCVTQPSTWNTLETCKLLVAALTPLAVALVGWGISQRLKRLEHLQWANQKLIEKRLEVYSKLAPALNDLYCYFDFIGDWKMKTPAEVLAAKRDADRLFYINAPLFSPAFQKAYNAFINTCFVPGPIEEYETNAKLRADVNVRKEMFSKRKEQWRSEWDSGFTSLKEVSSREEIVGAYRAVMDVFVNELGVRFQGPQK